MSKKTYWELLKDPRWQQMRLRVMEREGFACQECGDTEATLNVHHTYYERGNDPWEYPPDSLHCLCEKCHEKAGERRQILLRALSQFGSNDELLILGFVQGVGLVTQQINEVEVYDVEALYGLILGVLSHSSPVHQDSEPRGYARQLEANVVSRRDRKPITAQSVFDAIELKREFNAMDAEEAAREAEPDWGMAAHA